MAKQTQYSLQNTEDNLRQIPRALVASWLNGNRSYVLDEIAKSYPTTGAYLAVCVFEGLQYCPEDRAIFQNMLKEKSVAEMGPTCAMPSRD